MRSLVAADWLNDLKEFPAAVVADACQIWRRTEQRKPTIADIRKLCLECAPKPAERFALPRPTSNYERYVEDSTLRYREAEEARQRFAAQHGCTDFVQVMQRGILVVAGGSKAVEKSGWKRPVAQGDLMEQARKKLGITTSTNNSEEA